MKESASESWKAVLPEGIIPSKNNRQTFHVQHLSEGVEYVFRVAAANQIGQGEFSGSSQPETGACCDGMLNCHHIL